VLTSLQLVKSAIRGCSDNLAWASQQLLHLTSLKQLQLCGLRQSGAEAAAAPSRSAFGASLGQLVQLTSLSLRVAIDGAALAAVSRLSQLQRLELIDVDTAEQPLMLQLLPCSLTAVKLQGCDVSSSTAGSSSSSSSSGSASWQLPLLEQLDLWEVYGFQPAVMQHMQQLRVFSFGFNKAPEEATGEIEAQLVQVLPQLQRLQQLQLQCLVDWPSASSCTSITASSNLTALQLMDCSLPDDAVQHMFAVGQQLQQLQRVAVGTERIIQEPEDVFGTPAAPQDQLEGVKEHSLNLGPAEISDLASCCPRLRELHTIWCQGSGQRGVTHASQLAPLLQLMGLTKLGVGGGAWTDELVETMLGLVTGAARANAAAEFGATVLQVALVQRANSHPCACQQQYVHRQVAVPPLLLKRAC
jgi:hypothetical protein